MAGPPLTLESLAKRVGEVERKIKKQEEEIRQLSEQNQLWKGCMEGKSGGGSEGRHGSVSPGLPPIHCSSPHPQENTLYEGRPKQQRFLSSPNLSLEDEQTTPLFKRRRVEKSSEGEEWTVKEEVEEEEERVKKVPQDEEIETEETEKGKEKGNEGDLSVTSEGSSEGELRGGKAGDNRERSQSMEEKEQDEGKRRRCICGFTQDDSSPMVDCVQCRPASSNGAEATKEESQPMNGKGKEEEEAGEGSPLWGEMEGEAPKDARGMDCLRAHHEAFSAESREKGIVGRVKHGRPKVKRPTMSRGQLAQLDAEERRRLLNRKAAFKYRERRKLHSVVREAELQLLQVTQSRLLFAAVTLEEEIEEMKREMLAAGCPL